MRTTSLERTEAIFCALTEFRRLLGTENASSINALLKSKGVGHNHIPFIKAELLNRKLVNKSFTKWNDQMSKPTMLMAQSIAEYASRALSAYQKERKLARQHSVDPTRVPVEKLEGVKINLTPKISIVDIYTSAQQLKALAAEAGITLNIEIVC